MDGLAPIPPESVPSVHTLPSIPFSSYTRPRPTPFPLTSAAVLLPPPPPPPRSAPNLSRMATNDRFLEAIGEKAGDDVPMDAPDAAFSDDGEVPPVVGQWGALPVRWQRAGLMVTGIPPGFLLKTAESSCVGFSPAAGCQSASIFPPLLSRAVDWLEKKWESDPPQCSPRGRVPCAGS